MGKLLDWSGKEIIISPPTLQEEFGGDLIRLVSSGTPLEDLLEILFTKYKIEKC